MTESRLETDELAMPGPAAWPWARKLLGFDRPAITLDEDRHADLRERCIADVRAKIENADTDLDVLSQQASDYYREQDRRVDRAERRASSIGTATATLLGLTITGGGLLISAGFTQSFAHRTVVVVLTTVVVTTLVLAGHHALATQTTRHEWARPNAARYLTARAGVGDDLHLETLAALIAAALHKRDDRRLEVLPPGAGREGVRVRPGVVRGGSADLVPGRAAWGHLDRVRTPGPPREARQEPHFTFG